MVKDELLREGKPETLVKLVEEACEINDRFYERNLEKKRYYNIIKTRQK